MKRLLLLFCLMPMLVSAQIVYVTPSGAGAANGTSWSNAYPGTQLQTALNTVPVGGQVWVAAGTYLPTYQTEGGDPRTKTFYIDRGIKVYGGFPASGSPTMANRNPLAYQTILSGNIDPSGSADAYHVVYLYRLPATAVLDGLSITEGNANGSVNLKQIGGGIYNDGSGAGNSSNPTIANCLIYFCNAIGGGAILNDGRSGGNASPTISKSTFLFNNANWGGAIYNVAEAGGKSNPKISTCEFQFNKVTGIGGGILNLASGANSESLPEVTACSFFSNEAMNQPNIYTAGAGISNYAANGATVKGLIDRCSFFSNKASYSGGAIHNYSPLSGGGTCSPVIQNCEFSSNEAVGHVGGAIFNSANEVSGSGKGFVHPSIINCVFRANKALYGGAVYSYSAYASCKPQFINCTFVGNSATNFGGALGNNTDFGIMDATASNCIFWGNIGSQKNISVQTVTGFTVIHSLLDEATCPPNITCGSGMLYNLNPLFVDATAGDFRLQACSPALNVGNNASNATTKDIDNKNRKFGIIDLGAYELQSLPLSQGFKASVPNSPMCAGPALNLSATSGGTGSTYSWAGSVPFSSTLQNPTRPNASPAMSGTYSVTVNVGACSATASTSVVVSPNIAPNITSIRVNSISPNAQNTVAVCNNLPVTLNITATNAVTYSWKGPTGSGSGFTSSLVSPVDMPINNPKTGQYTITVRNGCATFNHKVINIQLSNCGNRLANAEAMAEGMEMDIITYPNPVSDRLTVEVRLQTAQSLQLRLINATGGQSGSWTLGEETTQHRSTLDLSQLPTGMYLLEAQAGQQRAVKRVVKVQ